MTDTVKPEEIGVTMNQSISQVEMFDLASQEEGSINTFLYEIQKHSAAQIINTSISDGVLMVEYTVPIEIADKAEEKNDKDK